VLATEDPRSTAFIDRYQRLAAAAGQPAEPQWQWVPYHRISDHLKCAVLVAEDINFFSHEGFETAEMRRALRDAVERKKMPRGASTITQQVAKNLWLSPSRNPWRKVKEAVLTRQLETRLSKRRILEIYLNVAELGPGIYGAEAASRAYFHASAAELDREQAARLAASLSRPSRWNPRATSRGYERRVRTILRRMQRAEWLRKVI
jgi:monofunctional biosynthetic peptidoglycan transglycosylase